MHKGASEKRGSEPRAFNPNALLAFFLATPPWHLLVCVHKKAWAELAPVDIFFKDSLTIHHHATLSLF